MITDVATVNALLVAACLALLVAIGAIFSLRSECASHRSDADKWRRLALSHASDPVAGPEPVWPGGDAGPHHPDNK